MGKTCEISSGNWRENGSIYPSNSPYIGHQACRGLAYALEKRDVNDKPYGIVHRDISPANILVSYEGDVKIADFGIAKAELNSGTTDVGVLKGKFEYMSPEQARGEEIDSSDLFSLGIVLHEILTGRRLFKPRTMQPLLSVSKLVKSLRPRM